MVLNTEYYWDQIPVKHLCHKLILRSTEWRAPARHWQLPCHFRSQLSPVSCSHDFVLTRMAPSVGLSSRWRSYWFLQIYRYVTKIFTCLDSELNYVVVLVIQRYFRLCGTSATTSKYAVIYYWERVSPLCFTHLTHFLWFWYSLAAYCPCLEISTLQLPSTL